MKKQILILFLSSLSLFQLFSAEDSSLRFDFNNTAKLQHEWKFKGKIPGVPRTEFSIGSEPSATDGKVLIVRAQKSSGLLIARVPKKVWEKNPVMHWRWRIIRKINLAPDKKEPDDQVAVLYWGDGTLLKQRTLAYRWEHHREVNTELTLSYSGGMTTVKSTCIKNKKAPVGIWHDEYRNVIKDYAKAFGSPPQSDCVIGIGANTQYTQSDTKVEIDFIEFIPNSKEEKKAK